MWVSTWDTGAYRSDDGGGSFAPKSSGLTTDHQADDLNTPHFGAVLVDETGGEQILFQPGFDGLFTSTNVGDQWTEVQTQSESIVGLAVSPDYANDHTVAATTYIKGAYLSNNSGASWRDAHVGLGSATTNKYTPMTRMHNVVFSPNYANDGTLFSSTHSVFARSTDRGASWETTRLGTGVARYAVAASPNYAADHIVYAGSAGGEVWRSTGNGAAGTWSRLATVGARIRSLVISPDFATAPVLYAGTAAGVLRSIDAGMTWTPTGVTRLAALAISPGYPSDGTVFAGTDQGLWVTRNAGATWSRVTNAPLSPSSRIEAVSVSPAFATDRTVLVSIQGRGLFRSTDGGTTFVAIASGLLANNQIVADYEWPTAAPIQFSPAYAVDRTIFAFTRQNIVRSTNGGATWTVLTLPPSARLFEPPTVAAAAAAPAVTEGAPGTTTVAGIAFDLSHPAPSEVRVTWQTIDLPNAASSADGDFVAASGTLVFPKGATRRIANVVVRGDAIDELDELLVVGTSNPINAVLGGFWGLGFGAIVDDDATPAVVPGAGTVLEGGDGETPLLTIPIALSGPSSRTITVDWRTLDYSATAGSDYVAASGTLAFAPGTTSATIELSVLGDTVVEPDELLLVATSNPVNATLGGFYGLGFGTIVSDDVEAAPPLSG
jgi:photosystem II stability/assembly factor-like uncharacterized protein